MKIGDKLVNFKLKGVDGKFHTPEEFKDKKALVIFFTCNHCPYVKANEDRIIFLQSSFKDKGVQFIGINANDDEKYPDDNFDNMVKRAKEKKFNFFYLRDENQSIARAYDAACTPEFYLFDDKRALRYHGKLDDNWQDPKSVKSKFLNDAINAVLTNRDVKTPEAIAIGCSIKWK